MKVVWIVNTIFPAPSKALGMREPVIGGWMYGLADRIRKDDRIELAVITVYTGTEVKKLFIDGVLYYLLPCENNIRYDVRLEKYFMDVYKDFSPEIVHIHGTEYAHGLASMRKFPMFTYIISIQGLVSVCEKYFLSGLSNAEILRNMSFRDIVKGDNLFQAKTEFKKRGILEKEYLKTTKHVIGRTQWDLVHAKVINPEVNYHFCNESLRDSFYTAEKWSIKTKVNFTIFCSQAIYPLKGLHQVLKAIALLKFEYPQIKLIVAGTNITRKDTFFEKIKLSGYGGYLSNLIEKLGIRHMVEFVGPLDERQIVREYQKAHIFICSSSIENSPNSLGEAQFLGVPSIATYVGGVPSMIEEGVSGLMYRFEEYEILAHNIRRIFSDDNLAMTLSKMSIHTATERHDRSINSLRTIEIYNTVVEKNSFKFKYDSFN